MSGPLPVGARQAPPPPTVPCARPSARPLSRLISGDLPRPPEGQVLCPVGHPSCAPGRSWADPAAYRGSIPRVQACPHQTRGVRAQNRGCASIHGCTHRVLRAFMFFFGAFMFFFGASCEKSAADLGGSAEVFVLFCLPWSFSEKMSQRRGLWWSGPAGLFLQPMGTGCP